MEAERQRRIIKLVFLSAAVLLVLLGLYYLFVRFGLGFVCLFHTVTGLKCPGCGNTHAVDALLHWQPREAFRYNYLFPVEFFYIAWVYGVSAASYLKNGRFHYLSPFRLIDVAVLAALLVWFIVRNILHI